MCLADLAFLTVSYHFQRLIESELANWEAYVELDLHSLQPLLRRANW